MRLIEHVAPKRSMPDVTDHIPTGFFDNASLERWLRRSLERIRMPNDFRAFERKTGRRLYITACDIDTAERVVFGSDEVPKSRSPRRSRPRRRCRSSTSPRA